MAKRNINISILEGHLTRDPELKKIGSGQSVANFDLAINHSEDSVSYIEISCFDKQADNVSAYLKKGAGVTVTGYLKQDRWDAPDGGKRNKIKLIATDVRFNNSGYKKSEENSASTAEHEYSETGDDDDTVF